MLDRAASELERGLAELRELARGIHPAVLTEDGLAAAIAALAERSPMKGLDGRTGSTVRPRDRVGGLLRRRRDPHQIAKYAAGASASVDVVHDGDTLRMTVRDDGPGGAEAYAGSGLQGLADRVAAVGGSFAVDSPHGGGTTIRRSSHADSAG